MTIIPPVEELSEALMPCPFCGGSAIVVPVPTEMMADCTDVYVRCQSCDATGPKVLFEQGVEQDDPHPEAISGWNHRSLTDQHRRAAEAGDRTFDALCGLVGLVDMITHRDDLPDEIRAAILQNHRLDEAVEVVGESTNAPASPPATGVRVKKLAWTDEGEGLSRAKTPFGFSYWANHRTCMWLGREDDWAVAAGDPSDSAQADYDALVLSALGEHP